MITPSRNTHQISEGHLSKLLRHQLTSVKNEKSSLDLDVLVQIVFEGNQMVDEEEVVNHGKSQLINANQMTN